MAAIMDDAPHFSYRDEIMSRHLFCVILFWASVTTATSAQELVETPVSDVEQGPTPEAPLRTGKERLGPKWTDEQRVNNCDVPPERRGSKPRPDACAADHTD